MIRREHGADSEMASMLTVDIPGWRRLQLEVLLPDVNGTLTRDGELLVGVNAGLKALVGMLGVQLVSADTFGRLDNVAAQLGVRAKRRSLDEPRRCRRRTSSDSRVPSAWSRSAMERMTRTCRFQQFERMRDIGDAGLALAHVPRVRRAIPARGVSASSTSWRANSSAGGAA